MGDASNTPTPILEESGYSDPFGDGCPNNFDIVQFINDSNNDFSTPVDSPADPTRFLNQLPTSHHPQQLMVHNHQQQHHHQQQLQQNHLQDNAYNTHPHPHPQQQPQAGYARAQPGPNTHLPDSPPITDISTGGSSASPSSDSYSPFSPHHQQQQQQYRHHGGGGSGGMIANPLMSSDAGGNLLSMQRGHNGGGQMMSPNGDYPPQQQMHLQRILQTQPPQQQQMSPQTEFFSPYPPSQSTPGSQASQVSPMSNATAQQRISYMFANQQPPQPPPPPNQSMDQQCQAFGVLADQLYSVPGSGNGNGRNSGTGSIGSSGSLSNGNSASSLDLGLDSISPAGTVGRQQQGGGGGHKRRRTSMNSENIAGGGGGGGMAATAMVKRESIDSGGGGGGGGSTAGAGTAGKDNGRAFGRPVQRTATAQRPPPPSSRASFTSEFDCNDTGGGAHKTIKACNWAPLHDYSSQELPALDVTVTADKGFNFSAPDNCFVNQKKNHFQITTNIAKMACERPYYVRLPSGELQPVSEFMLAFCGVKSEMPTSEIPVRQSTTERKPIPHEGVRFQIDPSAPTKQTVPRLHFSETTINNHRKHGKPNPEQKFFHLVVKLMANTPVGPILVQAYQSDRIIVRASNPGQFEQPDSEVAWQRGNGNVLTYGGQVAIGTEKPVHDAALTVNGNAVISGQITRPSDRRVKDDIADVDAKEALDRLQQMRIVEFAYKPEIAQQWGLTEESRHRVGVIAQELAEILPDAVRDNGDYLTVDDTRIFYDTVAAAQELHRLTSNLENKIDHVERISHKLARIAQKRKAQMGSTASGISDFSNLTNLFGTSTATGGSLGTVLGVGDTSGGGGNGKWKWGGGGHGKEKDNKSFVSCSSLASSQEGEERDGGGGGGGGGKKGGRDQHRRSCRSGGGYYCTRADPTLCTSKVTQGTIVTLVVVMALCLMAMCTLYVVDWYNRTYVYHPHPQPFDISHRVHVPPQDPNDPGGLGRYIESVDPYWKPPLDSDAPPLADYCPSSAGCPSFCCGAHTPISNSSGSGSGKSLLNLLPAVERDASVVVKSSPSPMDPSSQQQWPLESGVRIEVMNLNASLDNRYCTKESCDPRLGRYNLYVPVSPHLPTIPLTLKITTTDGEDLYVDNCGYLERFRHSPCEAIAPGEEGPFDMPTSYKVTDNIIELSVGSFAQSAYRFRIGHTSRSCSMPEDQQGRSFDEYNLVFYRTCGGDGGGGGVGGDGGGGDDGGDGGGGGDEEEAKVETNE